MWCLGKWLCAGLGSAVLMVGLDDHRGLFQHKWFCVDSQVVPRWCRSSDCLGTAWQPFCPLIQESLLGTQLVSFLVQVKVKMDSSLESQAPLLEFNYQNIICIFCVLNIHQEGPVDTSPGGSELKTYPQWMQFWLSKALTCCSVKDTCLFDCPGATLSVTLTPPELGLRPLCSPTHTRFTPGFPTSLTSGFLL